MTGRTYRKAICNAIEYVKAAKNGFVHQDWAVEQFDLVLDRLESLKSYEPPDTAVQDVGEGLQSKTTSAPTAVLI